MTDSIKKMLEPLRSEYWYGDESKVQSQPPDRVFIELEDFECVKRGFEKLYEQRNKHLRCLSHGEAADYYGDVEDEDKELLKAMRGE